MQSDGHLTRKALWDALKAFGWQNERHYRTYTSQELQGLLEAAGLPLPEPAPAAAPAIEEPAGSAADLPPSERPVKAPGRKAAAPATVPDDVLRIDEQGRQWLQEEVRKPAYPKPRGRRVLKYLDPGVKTETVQSGEYVETFEVAGERASRPAEVKITMPSYQVGIYRDPRFPFKIHRYNDREGFDLFDVNAFFGGPELVPAGVKRVYIENSLCYDVRSVVQAVQNEYRQLQLSGRA